MVTQRRRRAWSDTILNTTLAIGGAFTGDLLAGLEAQETKTVARILLDIWAFPDATDQSEAAAFFHFGIGVGSAEAFVAGVLPDPDIVADYPTLGWVYVASKPVLQGLPIVSGGGGVTRLTVHINEDLRGQRKVDRGVLYMTAVSRAITGVVTIRVVGRVRALCLR